MKKFNMAMSDPVLKLGYNSLVNLPTPTSISFLWNMGFLLGMTTTAQVVTGLMLSMNYVASTELAFDSVIHIMRDIEWGWVMRYSHLNGASLFFLLMYIHMARGVYFNSPMKYPMVWSSGVVIMLLSMMTAFMGYVLPWGQMSYWGATVITSMLTSVPYVGNLLISWLWGDFSVSQPTLNRMFSLHFIMPMVIIALVLVHLILLHKSGSSNPTGTATNFDKMKFYPFFMIKDTTPMVIIILMMSVLMSLNPEMLGDPENFNPASMTTTPTHIKPEWYFLFAYSILRSVPSKLGGVLAMAASILILLVLPMKNNSVSKKFNPKSKLIFWSWVSILMMLTWTGGKAVNEVSSMISLWLMISYFSVALLI